MAIDFEGVEEQRALRISISARVLVIEDRLHRQHWFRSRIPAVQIVDTSGLAIDLYRQAPFEVVFLDYHLHGTFTSYEFARYLVARQTTAVAIVHSTAPFGIEVLTKLLPQSIALSFGSFEIALIEEVEWNR